MCRFDQAPRANPGIREVGSIPLWKFMGNNKSITIVFVSDYEESHIWMKKVGFSTPLNLKFWYWLERFSSKSILTRHSPKISLSLVYLQRVDKFCFSSNHSFSYPTSERPRWFLPVNWKWKDAHFAGKGRRNRRTRWFPRRACPGAESSVTYSPPDRSVQANRGFWKTRLILWNILVFRRMRNRDENVVWSRGETELIFKISEPESELTPKIFRNWTQ